MFNGKIERLLKTLRLWHRFSLMPLITSGIQHWLDRFCDWHNTRRPHQALGHLTPEEAWSGWEPPNPIHLSIWSLLCNWVMGL